MVSGRTMSAAPNIGAAPSVAAAPNRLALDPSLRRVIQPTMHVVASAQATVTARPITNNCVRLAFVRAPIQPTRTKYKGLKKLVT